jgi:hypothetical protein
MGNYMEAILGKYTISSFIKEQDKKGATVSLLKKLKVDRKKQTANLVELVGGAEENLLSVHTVFPFVMIADTLKVDRQKLTIVHNALFRTSHTASIRLKDLRNVQADVGPLFGSITLTSQHFLNNTQTVKYLKRKDIIETQRLLQGFMIAHEAQIDTDKIEHLELKSLLNRLGQENIN